MSGFCGESRHWHHEGTAGVDYPHTACVALVPCWNPVMANQTDHCRHCGRPAPSLASSYEGSCPHRANWERLLALSRVLRGKATLDGNHRPTQRLISMKPKILIMRWNWVSCDLQDHFSPSCLTNTCWSHSLGPLMWVPKGEQLQGLRTASPGLPLFAAWDFPS